MSDGKTGTFVKIVMPVVIGIAVVAWLFHDEFSREQVPSINCDFHLLAAIATGCGCIFGRDWGMSWRFRILTDRELSWRQSVKTTMLCEFTSAITPSSVGGGALSMIFLNREGINMGRATTLTLTTLFLDELFFVISCPVIVTLMPDESLFGFSDNEFARWLKISFWIIYSIIFVWTAILFLGIIVKPRATRDIVVGLFSWKPLRRWKIKMTSVGDNMLSTSYALKSRSPGWFMKAFAATSISWLSRYLLVNALFWGFYPDASQLTVFGRQFIVWAILMVSPTPGGSGVSEYLFTQYYGDLISGSGLVLLLAMFWRVMSYYIYLIAGIFLLPSFLRASKRLNNNKST